MVTLNWNSCILVVPVKVAFALQTRGGNLKAKEWLLLCHWPKARPAVATGFVGVLLGTLQ